MHFHLMDRHPHEIPAAGGLPRKAPLGTQVANLGPQSKKEVSDQV